MTQLRDDRGLIFNIQHYSIHDGPGIRTTVFLKGCPLHCLWCQNPESQSARPEPFFNADRCKGCGTCVVACPEQAISLHDGRSWTDRTRCRGAGRCAEVCPNEARNLMGRYATVEEVFKEVNADAIFYKRSGGGVTLSGGDPVSQPRFATALLQMCKEEGLHTTLDTCGYARWEALQPMLQYVDLVLLDLKHMDAAEHRRLTGVSNELILENAKRMHHEKHIPLLARVPVIPGCNDSIDNLQATAQFIATELDASIRVHVLPYHRLGEAKYDRLEKAGTPFMAEPPSAGRMAEIRQVFESFGLTAVVGG